jgi:epoxyqueuosine reductase
MLTKEKIKQLAYEIGFDACGVAAFDSQLAGEKRLSEWVSGGKHAEMKYLADFDIRKNNFIKRFPDARSVIVLGVNYYSVYRESCIVSAKQNGGSAGLGGGNRVKKEKQSKFTSQIDDLIINDVRATNHESQFLIGRVARYAWGRDYHKVINARLEFLKTRIQQESREQIKFESSVDTKPFLERTLAQQAGLGFIGRQTQLLSPEFGPWLFLAELVTDLALQPDTPFEGTCGKCRRCIDACPTGAIEESGTIDARKCIAYLTIEHKGEIPAELKPKIGNWVFGCDVCLEACPYTAKQKETNWRELTAEAGVGPVLGLKEILEIKSNREHQKKFADSAISRVTRKQLLRNAKCCIDNIGP